MLTVCTGFGALRFILDGTCSKLIHDYQVGPLLLELLQLETNRLESIYSALADRVRPAKGELKSIVKVLHATMGAFKNLSLGEAYKTTLGDLDLIPVIMTILQMDGVHVLHYSGVVILKNLCALGNRKS